MERAPPAELATSTTTTMSTKSPAPASSIAGLNLPPGFRFHPTDEELMVHYLSRKAAPSQTYAAPYAIIAEVDLYKFDPWELPQQACFGEKEWYFFSPRERKYPNGARPNRAAASGYWKATGTDKPICSSLDGRKVGVKKALVFYKGRAPRGIKTNWIMHEYRLIDSPHKPRRKGSRLDDWVLCRIYKKKTKTHRSATSKTDAKKATASSVTEDVLNSLPDIDNSRISPLPRLGSLGGSLNDSFIQNLLAMETTRPTSNNNSNAYGNIQSMERDRLLAASSIASQQGTRNEQALLLEQFPGLVDGLHQHEQLQLPLMHEVPPKAAHNFFSDGSNEICSNKTQQQQQQQLTFVQQIPSAPQYTPYLDYTNSFQIFST